MILRLSLVPHLPGSHLRLVTYNIHKGVQGIGPAKRLEIHNLRAAIEHLNADIVCLQEVRAFNTKHAKSFKNWPNTNQTEYLAPPGYFSVYKTNATTKHGEHGNALLSKWPIVSHHHLDMSDHALEQRGLLHVVIDINKVWVNVIVLHLGLFANSRKRQIQRLGDYLERKISQGEPVLVAGDFNDWSNSLIPLMNKIGLNLISRSTTSKASVSGQQIHKRMLTFPSKLPLLELDYVYAKGLVSTSAYVPSGGHWGRLSDHLPLVVEFTKNGLVDSGLRM